MLLTEIRNQSSLENFTFISFFQALAIKGTFLNYIIVVFVIIIIIIFVSSSSSSNRIYEKVAVNLLIRSS